MNKFLFFILAVGFASAATAQQPADETAKPENEAATAIGTESSDSLVDRNCLRYTGSRITASHNRRIGKSDGGSLKCANATGRAYTQEDLMRTGETNMADALRMLDPAIH